MITSNGERSLPVAFVRRCVTLDIDPPKSSDLVEIAKATIDPAEHDTGLFTDLAELVAEESEFERTDQRATPSTAEYLDTVRACLQARRQARIRRVRGPRQDHVEEDGSPEMTMRALVNRGDWLEAVHALAAADVEKPIIAELLGLEWHEAALPAQVSASLAPSGRKDRKGSDEIRIPPRIVASRHSVRARTKRGRMRSRAMSWQRRRSRAPSRCREPRRRTASRSRPSIRCFARSGRGRCLPLC